jgi:hypothetical protein
MGVSGKARKIVREWISEKVKVAVKGGVEVSAS